MKRGIVPRPSSQVGHSDPNQGKNLDLWIHSLHFYPWAAIPSKLTTNRSVLFAYLFCQNQGILHEVNKWSLVTHIIEWVSCLQLLVYRVVHHCWWQCIEADHVGNLAFLILLREKKFKSLFLVLCKISKHLKWKLHDFFRFVVLLNLIRSAQIWYMF